MFIPFSPQKDPIFPGIEEFCAGLGEIAVSDSPLELKRMQCLGGLGSTSTGYD